MVEAIVAAVIVLFLVIVFARTIRIVPQARAGVVERLDGHRVSPFALDFGAPRLFRSSDRIV